MTDPAGNPNTPSTFADNTVTYIHSGTVQFSSSTYSNTEQFGPTQTITVTRVGGSDGALDVNFTVTPGSMNPATEGSDYTILPTPIPFHLHWNAGDPNPQTFDIKINDDSSFEGDETVDLR